MGGRYSTDHASHRYEQTMSKVQLASPPIQTGDREPMHLFELAAMHALVLESVRNLSAVMIEGSGGIDQWTSSCENGE